MKRTTIAWLLAGIATLLITELAAAEDVRLKIATLAPEGTTWMKEVRRGAEEIAERTEGRVTFRFYPGGTMGEDQAVLRKIRIGQLHGGALLAGGVSTIEPDLELFNLPLMFRSYEEVDSLRAEFDERLLAKFDDHGYVCYGFVETGFVYLMSTDATRTFADLEGRKTWVPEGDPISRAIADAAGLSPVPLAISDVLTGLQTGLIDTVAAPPVGAVALQWFTKAKYVTDLPITYVYGGLVLGKRQLSKIAPQDREVVREVLREVSRTLDRGSREANLSAREALVKQGVTFVSPTQEARVRWNSVAAEATRTLTKEQRYDRDLLAELQEHLERFRAQQSSPSSD
jgi:TRAP-type C4-dicarboxylate transport system substrate-binding protein